MRNILRKLLNKFAQWEVTDMKVQAGLGTYLCLDCIRPKKVLYSMWCHSCASSYAARKQWDDHPERRSKGSHVCPECGGLKRGLNTKRCRSCAKKEYFKDNPGMGWCGNENPSKRPEQRARMIENNPMNNPDNRAKISKTQRTSEYAEKHYGPNHYNWQGGKSFEPYGTDWKESLKRLIRDRDDHRCQICDVPENGKKHDVHHIDYNKKNCYSDNLITLCHDECHLATNYRKSYWPEHFKWLKGQKEVDVALSVQRGQ